MKVRLLAAAIAIWAMCWLGSPKAQAWRGFSGVHGGWGFRGGWGFHGGWGFRGGFGWNRPWGWGWGWNRPWVRPWGLAWNRPWVRPWGWGWGWNRPWVRPWWGWNQPYFAASYSPADYGNFQPYGIPYFYSVNSNNYDGGYYIPNVAYAPQPNNSRPIMPLGDGTFAYNGGPQKQTPPPKTIPKPSQPLKGSFVSVFPAYGEQPRPITTAKVPTQPVSYPAYGDQPSTPATVVSSNKR
jgi:hypothetical protein